MPTEERNHRHYEENVTEGYSFDELSRGLASGTLSRSRALKAVFAAILGGVFSTFALPDYAEARKRRRRALLPPTSPSPPTTLWAVVDADGTLVRGSGAVGSEKRATGFYLVTFNRDVSGCAYVASIGDVFGGEIGASETVPPPYETLNTQVWVQSHNSTGAMLDKRFHLVVNC